MSRLGMLQERRAALLAQAQRDREAIAAGIEPFSGVLRVADAGWSLVAWMRERPVAAGLAAAIAVALGARRGLRWMRLGLAAWQAWRWMRERRA
ncbi:MAG TPA: YqjK family protein [Burkholderiales bacterium]|nr:YqjK family protein [Burkholderiales bacterium]